MTSLPLSDVKVLDLSRLLPGPFCSLILADFGAEVLKLEDMGVGDYLRWDAPRLNGSEESTNSLAFIALNRNKRSVRINLKSPQGREVFFRLVRECDVVLETFRPGTLDRLGVGYELVRVANPRVVWCALSGYGQTGPFVQEPGHDLNYLGYCGILGISGEQGGPPAISSTQIADLSGAMSAAVAILVALRERDRSGEGQFLDVSLTDTAFGWGVLDMSAFLATGRVPERGEAVLGSRICYRSYQCSDGWVVLGALEPKFWGEWCRGVGREDLIEKQFEPVGSEIHREVERIFLGRSRDEWVSFGEEFECCVTPVFDLGEAAESQLVRERSLILEHDQPGIDGPVRTPHGTPKLSRTPADHTRLPAPALGEHTEEVLASVGYSQEEIVALFEAGAAGGRLPD